LTGLCVVLVIPMVVTTQPGGGYSDIAGIALILSALAILLNADPTGRAPGARALIVAATATGLAMGAKFQFIIPVAVLSGVLVIVARRGERVRTAVCWWPIVGVLGGFWYLRNFIVVGNPMPLLDVALGPVNLPGAGVKTASFTVAQYLFDGHIWSDFFFPG